MNDDSSSSDRGADDRLDEQGEQRDRTGHGNGNGDAPRPAFARGDRVTLPAAVVSDPSIAADSPSGTVVEVLARPSGAPEPPGSEAEEAPSQWLLAVWPDMDPETLVTGEIAPDAVVVPPRAVSPLQGARDDDGRGGTSDDADDDGNGESGA